MEERRGEYREFGRESQDLVEELEGRESELQASVEEMGLRRGRMEQRIARLETEEESGLLRRPSATGGGGEAKTRDYNEVREDGRDRGDVRGNRQGRDEVRGGRAAGDGVDEVRPDPGEVPGRRIEREQAREREVEIARNDIESRPVEPIPYEEYVRLYEGSAERYGFAGDWYILAAVGKIESNHGEDIGPSDAGPMQFLPSTWSSYGVDGNGDREANIMDPEDAIPAAAAYLKAGGAPDDWYAALFTYNRAGWYIEEVLTIAESYRRVHGDDNAGPYLKPVPAGEAPSRPEPTPRPQSVSDEGGEGLQEKQHPKDVPPPTDEDTAPQEDEPEAQEETVIESESPDEPDEATTGQYQYSDD